MSNFQGLLHDSLLATGHVECCTIIGRRDGTVKANSAGYEVSPAHALIQQPNTCPSTHSQPTGEQVDALLSAFRDTGSARENGIHFNGATYKCIRADKNSIYAKKVRDREGLMFSSGCRYTSTPWCMNGSPPPPPPPPHTHTQEGSGFVAVRTGNLIVFGSYSSSMFPSVCVEAVERLGE